ncbi:MAG: glutamate ligase domain-containing protein [Bullifex sp.]
MRFFLAGIKGTGMSHLYSFLVQSGHTAQGCDIAEDFFTSPLLEDAVIYPLDCHLPEGTDLVVYSSAYEKHPLPSMKEALENGIPCLSYPEALSYLTRQFPSFGVSGTHGKTTVSAVTTHLLESIGFGASSIYGSFLKGRPCAFAGGTDALILEACEYRDHFLMYDLEGLVITNIAFDHPDWFKDIDQVRSAFEKRVLTIKQDGFVICHSSLEKLIGKWRSVRPDLTFVIYGKGRYSVHSHVTGGYEADGILFESPDRNAEILSNYMAAMLLAAAVMLKCEGKPLSDSSIHEKLSLIAPHVHSYPGRVSRSEYVREEAGITFIDDYAHHPDEIRVCIDNIRKRYPARRIVVLFMPHTASRTQALMKEFVSALSLADAVFLQDIYKSARDDSSSRDLTGELLKGLEKEMFRTLYPRLLHSSRVSSDEEAVTALSSFLLSGDICITMGAGDNRKLIAGIAVRVHDA